MTPLDPCNGAVAVLVRLVQQPAAELRRHLLQAQSSSMSHEQLAEHHTWLAPALLRIHLCGLQHYSHAAGCELLHCSEHSLWVP